jgi:hypothetical protein
MPKGGKREGSGARPKPTPDKFHSHNIKMPNDLWAWCTEQGNASDYLRRLAEADRKKQAKKRQDKPTTTL